VLSDSWGWTENDRILNVLPLHHVHGIVNVLGCSLWNGAECVMKEKFSPKEVWKEMINEENSITSFMAVPTIYYSLIKYYEDGSLFNDTHHSKD
jgi:malonyl-CoA/methylmalonyl-CoA synthetase